MTKTNLALQVDPTKENGFFKEPLGQTKLLDRYHSFIFHVNLNSLEIGYRKLNTNTQLIADRIAYLDITDNLTINTFHKLELELDDVQATCHHRIRRGLINALGSVIKFVTGNLDDNDLQVLNANIERLSQNQNSNIIT